MKRVEKFNNGTSVITKMVYIQEFDEFLLIQQIAAHGLLVESQNTITLSREDIAEMAKEAGVNCGGSSEGKAG